MSNRKLYRRKEATGSGMHWPVDSSKPLGVGCTLVCQLGIGQWGLSGMGRLRGEQCASEGKA